MTKSFITARPETHENEYIRSIIECVQRKELNIALVIPVAEETFYVAKYLSSFPTSCHVLCSDLDTLEQLHDKWTFSQSVQSYKEVLPIPTLKVTSQKAALGFLKNPSNVENKFIMKPVHSRGGTQLVMCDDVLEKGFPSDCNPGDTNPWVIQEYIEGWALSSFSVVHKGKVLAHVAYECPYSISGFSVVRRVVRNRSVLRWVEKLVSKISFTGQIGFDFLVNKAGNIFPLECNPRATNGVSFLALDFMIYFPLYITAATCDRSGFTPNLVGKAFEIMEPAEGMLVGNVLLGTGVIRSGGVPYLKMMAQCHDDLLWLTDPGPILYALYKSVMILLFCLWQVLICKMQIKGIKTQIANYSLREIVVYPPGASCLFNSSN